jgi:hypothetical protein
MGSSLLHATPESLLHLAGFCARRSEKGVFIGFCRGNLLSNEQGIIEMGNRKRFGLIRYRDVKDINEETIFEILHEAILVDEELSKKSKLKKRKT